MSSKQIVYMCIAIGSSIGTFIPALWGSNLFSVSSTVFGMLGGFAGLWFGYKISF